MTTAIYRKYRPQTFAEVIGQQHITRTLLNEVISGQLAHAYLFCGMRGIGKTTVARLLAKAVNCEQLDKKSGEPCNTCSSCQAIINGRSLDLLEIDAASNRRIDDIREIKEHIPYGPSLAKYKVVIIDEVHMLTPEAFNALLKTLEEPPAHTIFILCTTEVHKLPETIISRCQRFDFKRINSVDLRERLTSLAAAEGVKVAPAVISQIVELAGGSSRDAESYLGKILSLGEKIINEEQAALVLPRADLSIALDLLEYLITRQPAQALEVINIFTEQGGDLSYFYKQVLGLMRKLLLVKLGGQLASESVQDLVPEHKDRLLSLADSLTQSRLQNMLQQWLEAEAAWRTGDLWQLPLELAALQITGEPINPDLITQTKAKAVPPAKEISAKLPTDNTSLTNNLTVQDIAERWGEVVAGLRDYNHSLSFILSVAKPLKLEGETLIVGFTYQLHLERVKDPKIVEVIEQGLQKVFGFKLRLKSQPHELQNGSDDLLSNVLGTFGGRVIS